VVRISPIKTNVNSVIVFIFRYDWRLQIETEVRVFISPHKLSFKHNFYWVCLYFSRVNNSLVIDSDVGMLKIISSQHLQKQITANCPDLSQILNLCRMLIGMRIYCRLQNNPNFTIEVILNLWYFRPHLINLLRLTFHIKLKNWRL
jgi:hypothetical protein